MSVTFYVSDYNATREYYARAESCDCMEAFSELWDIADANGTEYPDTLQCEACRYDVNLANDNAAELLRWVGLSCDGGDDTLLGEVKATELAALCRRRLWDESRNHDPALEAAKFQVFPAKGARLVTFGRREGYLRSKTEALLALAEKAGDRYVSWA